MLRRFAHLDAQASEALFHLPPRPLRASTEVRDVAASLGAVLYSPATSPRAAERLLDNYWPGVTAMVFCLEDAIADRDLDEGEERILEMLSRVRDRVDLAGTRDHVPLVFVRVRSPEHLEGLLCRWGTLADELDGLVLPKIGAQSAAHHLSIIASAQRGRDRPLWAMPIVEGTDIALRETRVGALLQLAETVAAYREIVPSVRVGATDLSGLWALRRSRDFTIYDIAVVRDIIADLVNVLGRDPDGRRSAGPVGVRARGPGLQATPAPHAVHGGVRPRAPSCAAGSSPTRSTACCARRCSTAPTACTARPSSTRRTPARSTRPTRSRTRSGRARRPSARRSRPATASARPPSGRG